jgi:hypothetical protein
MLPATSPAAQPASVASRVVKQSEEMIRLLA